MNNTLEHVESTLTGNWTDTAAEHAYAEIIEVVSEKGGTGGAFC